MTRYFVSRALISIAFGLLFASTGSTWWFAAFVGALAFAFFLWAPHSGRYAVYPELGVTALRRDERTQAVTDKAARNAFIAVMLALGGLVLFFGRQASIPTVYLQHILVLGAIVYFLADFWLRRI